MAWKLFHRRQPPSRTAEPAYSPADAELIRDKGEFDLRHYQKQAGKEFSLEKAIEHYVREGESRRLNPCPGFDVAFYLEANPDVEKAKVNAYAHYLRYGRGERRYANRSALGSDVQKVLSSGHFDSEFYRRTYTHLDYSRTAPVEHYLLRGWRDGRASSSFDAKFYSDFFPDVRESGLMPLMHFIDIGAKQGRATCFDQIKAVVAIENSGSLNPEFYRTTNQLDDAGLGNLSPVVHFVMKGARRWLNPNPDFCTEYYLRRYSDVIQHGVNPLHHYLASGEAEGRLATGPSYSEIFKEAQGTYLPSRPNLMVVLHECSLTGAPLLGLALIQELAKRYNIVVWAGKHGVLADDLEAAAFLVGYKYPDPLDCEFVLRDLVANYPLEGVIANSVETSPVHRAILACDIPSVGLVHEFSEYTAPVGKLATVFSLLDRCVVPAELVRKSALKEIESIWGGSANNIVVQPQGHLPRELWSQFAAKGEGDGDARLQITERLKGKKTVLGAGFVHIRKGVELFIETAQWVKEMQPKHSVHFLWIGDGYAPGTDVTYSVWLQDAIQKWGLQDTVTFVPAQRSIDWAFDLSDVFFLSSRLDPFPNVVVDAMAASVPVVCFDETTGCAEFMRKTGAAGAVVPYLDTRAAAAAIIALIAQGHHQNQSAQIVAEHLAMPEYVRALERELKLAKSFVAERRQYCEEIDKSDCFDRAFYESYWKIFPTNREAIREFSAHCMKGMFKASPLPGFNDGEYRAKFMPPAAGNVFPLLHAIRHSGGALPKSHDCLVVNGNSAVSRMVTPPGQQRPLKIALHAHLFYAELMGDFTWMLRKTGIAADLFISSSNESQAREIGYHLHDYGGGRVTIRTVPNAGRDIGPFITEFGADILAGSYDIVGHLHGKKTKVLGPKTPGDAWRTYLWDNLLQGEGVWETVHAAFAGDPQLGLLFAEDRHVVGWTKNRAVAEELMQRFGLSRDLPAVPVFPLGTMFWCRPQAIAPVLKSGLAWADYPPEPLPYDGTILHAMERLLPTVCEQSGYAWKTIYLQGSTW